MLCSQSCDPLLASDSKLCAAFFIAPKSDPLLPFLAFSTGKICFWMGSTRKQPALLLQLDPCLQLSLRLKQRGRECNGVL